MPGTRAGSPGSHWLWQRHTPQPAALSMRFAPLDPSPDGAVLPCKRHSPRWTGTRTFGRLTNSEKTHALQPPGVVGASKSHCMVVGVVGVDAWGMRGHCACSTAHSSSTAGAWQQPRTSLQQRVPALRAHPPTHIALDRRSLPCSGAAGRGKGVTKVHAIGATHGAHRYSDRHTARDADADADSVGGGIGGRTLCREGRRWGVWGYELLSATLGAPSNVAGWASCGMQEPASALSAPCMTGPRQTCSGRQSRRCWCSCGYRQRRSRGGSQTRGRWAPNTAGGWQCRGRAVSAAWARQCGSGGHVCPHLILTAVLICRVLPFTRSFRQYCEQTRGGGEGAGE